MRVYFDDQIFVLQKFGGISTYFIQLISHFIENPHLGIEPVFSPKVRSILESGVDNSKYPLIKFLYEMNLKKYQPTDIDIIHFTYYLPNILLYKKSLTTVSTIHDFIPENYFSNFSTNRYMHFFKKSYLFNSTGIIYISNFTKFLAKITYPDLRKHNSIVIYHGVQLQPKKNFLLDTKITKYFLYVGKRASYKNFHLLLEAFAEIAKDSYVQLVCFGGEKISYDENIFIKNNNIRDKVFFLNDSNSDIGTLYKNALAFVNTSQHEGFGITNLEALLFGCPVICSNIPVFKEILGNTVHYFDRNSKDSLVFNLRRYINTTSDYKQKLPLIKFARRYSWNQAAKETADYYHNLLI